MIAFAEVGIGEGLVRCTRCAAPTSPVPRSAIEIERDLHSAKASYSDASAGVALIGFEPFAHPELPQIIGTAVSVGFDRIRLRTDAGALGLHGNAAGVIGAGVRHVEVVLLGDAETHDRLSGRAGLHDLAAAGLQTFIETAGAQGVEVNVSAHVPVCKHNITSLSGVSSAAARMGASSIDFDIQGLKVDDERRSWLDAALSTATINLVAACVSGADGFDPVYSIRPWSRQEWIR